MSSKDQQHDELDFKQQRPVAGETRRFATGEAVFFSPLPVPTGQTPMDLGGSFLEVNDTYLDVGSSNTGKSFQVRVAITSVTIPLVMCLLVGPIIGGFMAFGNPYGRTFIGNFIEFFYTGAELAALGGIPITLIFAYAVISTTLQKARTRPIRFNRQRREVCYFPEGSDEPVIQPWEDTVAWLSVSTGSTGVGMISNYTFGMAIDDPKADTVHFLTHGVLTPFHGLGKWEAIRLYMEKGPGFCPGKASYEGKHSFDLEREDMHEAYRDKYCSLFGVVWWYFSHVFTWWRFPYWVAEWDHRYGMKALPDSIAPWSQPLPPEQWAQPSVELQEQSAKLEKAFAQGQSFMSYFKVDKTLQDEPQGS